MESKKEEDLSTNPRRRPSNFFNFRIITGLTGISVALILTVSSYFIYNKASAELDKINEDEISSRELLLTSGAALRDNRQAIETILRSKSKGNAAMIETLLTCRSMNKRVPIYAKELEEEGLLKDVKPIKLKGINDLNETSSLIEKYTNKSLKELSNMSMTTPQKIASLIKEDKKTSLELEKEASKLCTNTITTYNQISEIAFEKFKDINHTKGSKGQLPSIGSKLSAFDISALIQLIAFSIANLIDVDNNLPI